MRKLLANVPGAGGSLGHDASGQIQCERPYSWQPGASFWASDRRIRARGVSFWSAALDVLLSDEDFKSEEDPGKVAGKVGKGPLSALVNVPSLMALSLFVFFCGRILLLRSASIVFGTF